MNIKRIKAKVRLCLPLTAEEREAYFGLHKIFLRTDQGVQYV